jgi:hypothetical protein
MAIAYAQGFAGSPVQLLKMPRCFWYLSHFKPTMMWTLLATPPRAPSGAHVPFIIFIATAMKSAFILFNFVRMSLSLALGLSQCCCRWEEGQTHAPLQSLQLQPITNHFNPFHQWHEIIPEHMSFSRLAVDASFSNRGAVRCRRSPAARMTSHQAEKWEFKPLNPQNS